MITANKNNEYCNRFKITFFIIYNNQLLLRRMGINTLHGHSPNSVDMDLSKITLNFILI